LFEGTPRAVSDSFTGDLFCTFCTLSHPTYENQTGPKSEREVEQGDTGGGDTLRRGSAAAAARPRRGGAAAQGPLSRDSKSTACRSCQLVRSPVVPSA
jgi:hypothetical protein